MVLACQLHSSQHFQPSQEQPCELRNGFLWCLNKPLRLLHELPFLSPWVIFLASGTLVIHRQSQLTAWPQLGSRHLLLAGKIWGASSEQIPAYVRVACIYFEEDFNVQNLLDWDRFAVGTSIATQSSALLGYRNCYIVAASLAATTSFLVVSTYCIRRNMQHGRAVNDKEITGNGPVVLPLSHWHPIAWEPHQHIYGTTAESMKPYRSCTLITAVEASQSILLKNKAGKEVICSQDGCFWVAYLWHRQSL
jgi:hypothetical protein